MHQAVRPPAERGRPPLPSIGLYFVALASIALFGTERGTARQHAEASAAPPSARELLVELCSTTRLAGTSGSARGADIVARRLAAAGLEVEIDEREVMLSLPRSLELAIYDDGFAERPALERLETFDPDAVPPTDVPPYSAWSPSGDVRGEVVDVGYGLSEDYRRLARAGIDVGGRIVLARYGRAYRGVKVDVATRHGAIGVLLFSDPEDDGADKGPTWPDGPWKPDWAVQRGSISPMGRIPGDPSTPGWASPAPGVEGRRATTAELDAALPRIPCLPIRAADARAIRDRLAVAPGAGDDGGDEDRRVGPGPVEVRMALDIPRELRTIRNVLGRIEGASGPDGEFVMIGNHRDAWVRGAHDAGSGTVALLRAAYHLGARVDAGWRPASSIVFAFWDAEEFSLIGSTEWGEAHADRCRQGLVAYVNADAAVSGTELRRASGTPGLLGTLQRALLRVPTPGTRADGSDARRTLWDDLKAAAEARGRAPQLGLPGSGSDFTVFLHHLGLPVLDLSLSGNGGGQYHTRYDDVALSERFLDPGFVGHDLAGRLFAELLTELADKGRDAFNPREAATELARHARAAGEETDDAGQTWLGAERAERLATAFDRVARSAPGSVPFDFYGRLAAADGLPGRAWYRNRLWTPGLETGYRAETFPTLRSAAARGPGALDAELDSLVAAVRALADDVDTDVTGSE